MSSETALRWFHAVSMKKKIILDEQSVSNGHEPVPFQNTRHSKLFLSTIDKVSKKSLTYTVQTAKAQIKSVVKRGESEAMLRRCERHRGLDESGSGVRAG